MPSTDRRRLCRLPVEPKLLIVRCEMFGRLVGNAAMRLVQDEREN